MISFENQKIHCQLRRAVQFALSSASFRDFFDFEMK